MSRRLSIFGATGSVGGSTLDLVERAGDGFELIAVTAASNVAKLVEIARRFNARRAVIADEAQYADLKALLEGSGCEAAAGPAALVEAARMDCDLHIAAIVGCAGLEPTMAAVEDGRMVGLANKESLITAGALMTSAAHRSGATLLPIDSEHNAIFQCLAGNRADQVSRIILTASGGPFRSASNEAMAIATPAQAVAHPSWTMGAKISVDSATLMNKGLELIEASYLFGQPSERIDIVVHPQSIVHSMVEYVDGSVIAQLGTPDMRIPIAYALAWPERMETPAARLDLIAAGRLDFEAPDLDRFPALRLARAALVQGGAAPVVLNAANEIAVERFLGGALPFPEIAGLVERLLDQSSFDAPHSIGDVLEIDRVTRERAGSMIGQLCP
jgi:1-deoxy-D-xylulose-5-phosphate reductoisomerase